MRTRCPARCGAYCGRALAVLDPVHRAGRTTPRRAAHRASARVPADEIGGIAVHIGARVSALARASGELAHVDKKVWHD
jgi:hypothetical protein